MRPASVARRDALKRLAAFTAASPLALQGLPGTVTPPSHRDEVMGPVNLHEMEEIAKAKLHKASYDHVAAGAGDELTMRGNREAYDRVWIRRRVANDVSRIDTALDLLGRPLPFPILLAPAGAKILLHPDGEAATAAAAQKTSTIYVTGAAPRTSVWWAATLGHATKNEAQEFARKTEGAGASAICVSVDYPYTGARDRNSRNHLDLVHLNKGFEKDPTETPPVRPFRAGMIQPYTPNMTWDYLDWLHGGSSLPVVVKGVVTREDAALAVSRGASAIVVSNHGGRTLDGSIPTLYALPEVVEAVEGRIPVLVDGGIRRGTDIVKALALGAKAILIGRPYLWGLAAFGQEGVERVVELLQAELRIAMGMGGVSSLAAIDKSMVRFKSEPR
jgi:isopentenyl diphosphate isomerase/L-lactate dehydrogenase-like FMN-dependent dehydrogenase